MDPYLMHVSIICEVKLLMILRINFGILLIEEHLAGGVQAAMHQVPINQDLLMSRLHLLWVLGHGVALQRYKLYLLLLMNQET